MVGMIRDMSIDMDTHEQRDEELQTETLPGSCKSLYALQFRMKTDTANANFAQRTEKVWHKKATKGMFPIPYTTNAGMWMKDREWKMQANQKVWDGEQEREKVDVGMLEKRKKQKML